MSEWDGRGRGTAQAARHPSRAPTHSPAEGHGTKGVAALVLQQAGAELGQAAEEEAKGDGQLVGAHFLSQLGLGALQQRGRQRKAVQAQRRGVGGGGVELQRKGAGKESE